MHNLFAPSERATRQGPSRATISPRRSCPTVAIALAVLLMVVLASVTPALADAPSPTVLASRLDAPVFGRGGRLGAASPELGAATSEPGFGEASRGRTFTTGEYRSGQGLEAFPFPIMTDPPHSFHEPVADLEGGSMSWRDGSRRFFLPAATNHLGLYGRFWLSPKPLKSTTRLVGVEFINPSWQGTADNSILVFSLLDTTTQDNALGTVSGATQGIAGQLVGVLFEYSSSRLVLRLDNPVRAAHRRFVLVIDAENLPSGRTDTVYPSSIAVSRITWIWSFS